MTGIAIFALSVLFLFWSFLGYHNVGLHADLSRDLHELSNLWIHRIVWLGPQLRVGFPASPMYYYLLFPGIILSNGNARSLAISQAFFAFVALGLMIFAQKKEKTLSSLIATFAIGLSPWWIRLVTNPWNGNMYAIFLLISLVLLWNINNFFIAALSFGIALSLHPAAIFATPIFMYELLRRKNKLQNIVLSIIAILLPWTPIILYEWITKGFLTRQWLVHQSTGIEFLINLGNLRQLIAMFQLPTLFLLFALLATILWSSKRMRYWIVCSGISYLALLFLKDVHTYYLLGITTVTAFIMTMSLRKTTAGKVILFLIIFVYLSKIVLPSPTTYLQNRTIPMLESTVDQILAQDFDKEKTYALVSVIDEQSSAPQADDYRFFFRTKGIGAVNIEEYPSADYLIVFFEPEDFPWQNWEDWHTQYFGSKKFQSHREINGIQIVQYQRE